MILLFVVTTLMVGGGVLFPLFGGVGDEPSWLVAGATLAVVDRTVQPASVSLWLRPPGASGGSV